MSLDVTVFRNYALVIRTETKLDFKEMKNLFKENISNYLNINEYTVIDLHENLINTAIDNIGKLSWNKFKQKELIKDNLKISSLFSEEIAQEGYKKYLE